MRFLFAILFLSILTALVVRATVTFGGAGTVTISGAGTTTFSTASGVEFFDEY